MPSPTTRLPIFSANANLTLETLERLAYALQISPVELLGEFPSLLTFVHSDQIPFEDYLRLKEEVPDAEKPDTLHGWRAFYRQWKAEEYPGLAAYLQRAGLVYEDIAPLIRALRKRQAPLPRSADAWEQQHRWYQAFPPE